MGMTLCPKKVRDKKPANNKWSNDKKNLLQIPHQKRELMKGRGNVTGIKTATDGSWTTDQGLSVKNPDCNEDGDFSTPQTKANSGGRSKTQTVC
jgi:hypothetical protein